MGTIRLINIDSTIPNLALAKIEKYHRDKGDEVIYGASPQEVDKTYVSCVFKKNAKIALEWEGKAEIGGSGVSLKIVLPEEIERVKPRINLGFTTRGCIRKCSFCVVPEKEGKIHVVGDLLDLWDGTAKDILVMDNNILALPEHFELVCRQAKENKIRVDFNQGLDHRLISTEIAKIMKKTPHKEYRLAYDHPSYKNTVEKAIEILKSEGINRCQWYVLVGYNTTWEEDIERCNYLRERNQNVFIQRYETCYYEPKYVLLAKWGNQHHIFRGYTWDAFLSHPQIIKRAIKIGLKH